MTTETSNESISSYPQLVDWKQLLAFVHSNPHSSFYRDLYARAGFDPETDFNDLADISKIPLLTKSDLLTATSLCFVAESEIESLSSTSGTTGNPLVTYQAPSSFMASALRPEHADFGTTLLLFGPMRAGSVMYNYHKRGQPVIMGDMHNLPATCAFAAQGNIRTITTSPTLAIILKKYIDAQPSLVKHLKYLRLGGEALTLAKKSYIQSLYPGVTIFTVYASSEAGWSASQCIELAKQDATYYHPNHAGFYLEIIDDELVVTDFTNLGTPLIRYRTGDRAKFIDQECTCGITGPLIEITGRTDYDAVRAGGFEIRRDMVEPVLLQLTQLLHHDFELTIHETYHNEKPYLKLTIHVSLLDSVSDSIETRHTITKTFDQSFRFSPTMSFTQAKDAGLVSPLELVFVTFPHQAKAIQRIILK